jgi:hypothetical protein
MSDDSIRHRQFEEALRNVLARLKTVGKDRIERTRIEELGWQYGLDEEESRRLFVESKGDVWEGELVESEGEPGWGAATLENIPSTGRSSEEGI